MDKNRIRIQMGDTIYYQLSKIESTKVYERSDDCGWVLQVKLTNGHLNEEVFATKAKATAKQAEIDDAIAKYRDFVDKIEEIGNE